MQMFVKVTENGGANCYMLCGNDWAVIIDPGSADKEIVDFARENSSKHYKYILLTHCHYDHITGVPKIKEIFGGKTVIGKGDAAGLEDTVINLSGTWTDNPVCFSADITVDDGDTIDLGTDKISVMQTPGHTAGCVCYIMGDDMFTGDTLFKQSVGRYDLPTSSVRQLLASLKKLGAIEKNYNLYPGHGEKTTLEDEKKYNNFFRRVLNEIK